MSLNRLEAEPTVRLHHGTTRQRAESILRKGPDPNFLEPGGQIPERAFFTAREEGPFSEGNPRVCAKRKAAIFGEGGPAIVEMDVPISVIDSALDLVAEIVFGPGYGLQELVRAWPSLSKRVLLLPSHETL